MDTVFDLLKIFGSLGVFIFGMKLMSDGVQKIAGPTLRRILSGMTKNRLAGVMTGFMTTSLIQSSSATTVMVVSFVNAGLLTLVESTGVIMGANIGTTATAWLVSFLGFGKFKIAVWALYLIAVTFPFFFSKVARLRNFAEFVMGFGILFIGLSFLKESVPDIKENPEILEFLQQYTDAGMLSLLIFVAVGSVLTILVQSSSATMAITLTLLAQGLIDFKIGAAMVLGENIGTTITANVAALVGNVHAKRAARFHSLFNIIGVIWMLFMFSFFLKGIDWLNQTLFHPGSSVFDAVGENKRIATDGLALFHTAFNILNVALLFFFTPLLARLVVRLLPARGADAEEYKLQYIGSGFLSTPELSIEQANKEVQAFGKLVEKMTSNVMILLFKEPKSLNKLMRKIKRREELTDSREVEVGSYLTRVGEQELSVTSASRVRGMLRILHDLERIGDVLYMISLIKQRMIEKKIDLPERVKNELSPFYDMIYKALKNMNANLAAPYGNVDMERVYELEGEINDTRDLLRSQHFERLEKSIYSIEDGVLFLNLINNAEKLGDHIVNVNEALAGIRYTS